MAGKKLRTIISQLPLMSYTFENGYMFYFRFKAKLKLRKISYSFNNSKLRRMALSCSNKPPVLLRETNDDDFCCLNCHHCFITKNKLESHKKVYEEKNFCNIVMPFKDTKMLELNKYQKSDKGLFNIYADFECLKERIGGCKSNPENLSTTKVGENIQSAFTMPTISSLKSIENKHDVHRGKDCMKKFCKLFGEQVMKIINFKKKKKMKFLTKEQQKSNENAKFYYICREKFEMLKMKNYLKVTDHCLYTGE